MFDNIQRFILHVLAENIAQACTLLVGLAFKDSRGLSVFPLAPVQIIWIIMVPPIPIFYIAITDKEGNFRTTRHGPRVRRESAGHYAETPC